MDVFFSYNQIQMASKDDEKTTSTIDRGLFYYKVMSFSLNNTGDTYQWPVNKIFKKQIDQNIEVYMDDMLVKSRASEDDIVDLKKTFITLYKYQMKLNPMKCAFGVTRGSFSAS